MKLHKIHWASIIIAAIILFGTVFLASPQALFFTVGISILIAAFPFVLSTIKKARDTAEKEGMFLEFARGLVESVKTGTPISKSIINVRNRYYGPLTKHIQKLANQIVLGIPLTIALQTFAKDVDNRTISRSITLIGQAEKSGGEIGEILESVAEAVNTSDKLKKERKAAISSLVVQGYIIFFVFIIIILVMQFQILPMISNISGEGLGLGGLTEGVGTSGIPQPGGISQSDISNSFLYLLLFQGFFSGLTIGKLAEGDIRSGIKHSFALMLVSFLISAGANLLFVI